MSFFSLKEFPAAVGLSWILSLAKIEPAVSEHAIKIKYHQANAIDAAEKDAAKHHHLSLIHI